MDPYLFKHLMRKPWMTAASFVFCTAICFLMCFLSTYVSDQQAELVNTQKNMDIQCVVTNARGNQTTDLGIREKYISFVMNETSSFNKYVRDIETVKSFDGKKCPFSHFIGISSETCAENLDPAMGGYYVTDVDFMRSSEFVCLVSEELYGLYKDMKFTAELHDPRARNEDNSMRYDSFDFTVVGYYKGEGNDVYIPINTAIAAANKIGGTFKLEEMRFYVKDNTLLDEMKSAAHEVFIEAKPENDRRAVNFALVFYDSNYITTVATLQQSIESTRFLIPFIMILGLGLGFIISFLSTRSESRRYALMRAVGMTKGKLFFSVLREQSVIPLFVSAVISLILLSPIPALEFFVFYEVGCITAVIRAVSVRPMTILRED